MLYELLFCLRVMFPNFTLLNTFYVLILNFMLPEWTVLFQVGVSLMLQQNKEKEQEREHETKDSAYATQTTAVVST